MESFWTAYPRDVLRVSGPDAASYLHSQLSQDLNGVAVGDSAWAFLLQPAGKIDVLLRVWRTGPEEFVLDTDGGFGDVLTARLNRFKIRVKADIEPLDWSCIAVRGAGVSGDVIGWGNGRDLLGPEVGAPVDAIPVVREGSLDDLLAARIEAVWPAMGVEIVPGETIPAETGIAAQAVSFTKGCYPGQELVERMDSRGASAPRLLQRVEAPEGAAPGQPVLRDGAAIGTYTSVHGTAALAYLKRSALAT